MQVTNSCSTPYFSLLQSKDPLFPEPWARTMDYIESVEVPQPGVIFAVVSKNNLAEVVKTLTGYESGHTVRRVDSYGPFQAIAVHFKDLVECVRFYTAFVEATASRAVLRQIVRIEEISNRARLQKNREKTAARRRKVGSEVVDSD